ncbi:flagellar hook-length control protein FliK [Natronospira bacteriovora]|uniref:Flagellar hook-length control protein FliK n=1 Tax=Natronospira bacteriovora TaxID=3069753 RepID=A0ABU0W625_9GAMM|nr:flagellar hook-length control protein FliK [Natronospira sp. AB-CW4]MDQ2068445.1 flagellar hook-length control protein FliK [Natronospira sp. AB-CW4]
MSDIRISDLLAGRAGADKPHRGVAGLRAGQVVAARLVQQGEQILLQIGRDRLPIQAMTDSSQAIVRATAPTGGQIPGAAPLHPPAGTRLVLEVLNTGQTLDMRVLEARPPLSPGAASPAHETSPSSTRDIDARLRRLPLLLNQQSDSRALLNSLRALMRAPATPDQRLTALREALAPMMQALRTPTELSTPAGVSSAVADSGLNTEKRLMAAIAQSRGAQGPASDPLTRDWKAALGRSLMNLHTAEREGRLPPPRVNATRPGSERPQTSPPGRDWFQGNPSATTPRGSTTSAAAQATTAGMQGALLRDLPEALRIIVRQIEGAMARSELHQLASSNPESESGRSQLWFEIPVSRQNSDDIWQFLLEERRRKDSDEMESWTVTVGVTIPELGPFHARLRLRGERISIHLYAHRTETLETMRQSLDHFRERLRDAGLTLERLQLSAGSPSLPDAPFPHSSFRGRA